MGVRNMAVVRHFGDISPYPTRDKRALRSDELRRFRPLSTIANILLLPRLDLESAPGGRPMEWRSGPARYMIPAMQIAIDPNHRKLRSASFADPGRML